MTEQKKEICEECEEFVENCVCSFDFIFDIPKFIKRRSLAIHKKRENEIFSIKRIIILLNHVFEQLPQVYVTRSGCEVEEFPMQLHSEHDSARNIGALMITEYNELLVNLCIGSYNSAVRNIRSLIEWLVRTVAAVSDRSILTKPKNKNKNKAVCFAGLKKMMLSSRSKERMDKQYRKKLRNELKNYSLEPQTNQNILSILNSEIKPGVGSIPSQLNEIIKKNLIINDPLEDKSVRDSEVIYLIYDILSQYIHNSIDRFYDLEPGGATKFFDSEQFDIVYSIIMTASDIVLYFYFILLDIDVFHSNQEWKQSWRYEIKKIFTDTKMDQKYFSSTKSLLHSTEWNKKPPIEFVYAP